MKKLSGYTGLQFIFFMATFLLLPMVASEAFAGSIATFSGIKGEVRVLSRMRAEGKWLRVKKAGIGLFNGDRIRTIDGTAEVSFPDGSIIKVSKNSDITIEERPTRRKLFGFVDISFVNRNVKVAFGKLWANVKYAKGKWTSFDTRSAVAGIKGTTITLEVDSFGNMNLKCVEGVVEISRPDGAVGLQLESGKQVLIKTLGKERTLIQSVRGEIGIETDGTRINLENKGAAIIGPREGSEKNKTFIEVVEGSAGAVSVIVTELGIPLITVVQGEVEMTKDGERKTYSIGDELDINAGVNAVLYAKLYPGEAIILVKDEDEPGETTIVVEPDNRSKVDLIVGGVTVVLDADDEVNVQAGGEGSRFEIPPLPLQPPLVEESPPASPI